MPRAPGQLELLDWQAPQPVARFDAATVRARGIAAQVSRAVAAALRDAEAPRETIAARMGEYLGERVSRHVLDAYASQARDQHRISLPRFLALVHATGDRRLLQVCADLFGWAVVERRFLPMIELGAVAAQRQVLARQARVLSLQAAREARRT